MPGAPAAETRPTQHWELKKLLLDAKNPRFGFVKTTEASQADILDKIVDTFGVDDLLSSLAVNGYFEAEPMVCRKLAKDPSFAVVAEGNRRLAACLIIAGDPRASRQARRTTEYRALWEKHGEKQLDPAPVIFFGDQEQAELLSYLGVRHISSAKQWDSYAKAAWVAQLAETSALELDDIALMIGDNYNTIKRMLQGYYFVNQLVEAGEFRPEDSQRKGRGSITEYPFSWIYTLLGYSATRDFLGLDVDAPIKKDPLPKPALSKGGVMMRAMFGDKSKGKSSLIDDSRDLGELASVLADPEKLSLLEAGRSLKEIRRTTQPIDERLRAGLAQVREIQTDLAAGLSEQEVPSETAAPLVDLAKKNRRAAASIEETLRKFAGTPGGE